MDKLDFDFYFNGYDEKFCLDDGEIDYNKRTRITQEWQLNKLKEVCRAIDKLSEDLEKLKNKMA